MRALWTDEVASFTGDHVRIEPSWQWPKPLQSPLPVLLGGAAGPKLFDAIVEYGDGWIPIGGAGLASALPQLRDQWTAAGRDPAALRVATFGTIPDRGKLERYRELGVTEVVLRVPEGPTDEALTTLDRYTESLFW